MKIDMVSSENALSGRTKSMSVPAAHHLNGHPISPPFPRSLQQVTFALGCFWGAERLFWQTAGVYSTAVGYAGGYTPNPTYQEVCSGQTGHTEVVLVVFDPEQVSLEALFTIFWESHDPTQGMRQGNDRGTQYRSAIYSQDEAQLQLAQTSLAHYQQALNQQGHAVDITTELKNKITFYYAEDYHQQYLAKNPNGYCGLKGSGIAYCQPKAV